MKFLEIEPFEFGRNIKTTPKLTTELKMRLKTLKFETETDIEHAKDVIAKCFGKDEDAVREFAKDNLYPGDLQDIQIMLLRGPQKFLEAKQQVREFSDKKLEEAFNAMTSDNGEHGDNVE